MPLHYDDHPVLRLRARRRCARAFVCPPASSIDDSQLHSHGISVRLYRAKLDEYYGLNKREGRAYGAYAVATTLLPNLVIALVLFYGGQLVLNNDDGMTSGKLVRG